MCIYKNFNTKLFTSVENLKNAEYLTKCDCLNLNTAIQNLYSVLNLIKDNKENLDINNLNLTRYVLL